MVMVLGFAVFAAAFGASAWVLAFTLAPAMPRIISLLRDGVDPTMINRPALILTENRVQARIRSRVVPPVRMPLRVAA